MPASWKQLTFVPSSEALESLANAWGWLVPAGFQPFMAACSGDVFYRDPKGAVHWLDTGAGSLTEVAQSVDGFLEELRADDGRQWLLAPLIDQLLDNGVGLAPDQCFGYKQLPILGGDYVASNMFPLRAAEWWAFAGDAHQQMLSLPDGTRVRLALE